MSDDRRIDAAREDSRTLAAFRAALEGSAVARVLQPERLAAWYRSSAVGRTIDRVGTIGERAAVVRASARTARVATDWTTRSVLYRWLTTEPEPDPIVIDLRETWTVGPLLALLERIATAVGPAVRRSRIVRAASAVDDAIENRPVRTTSYFVLAATAANGLATAAAGELTETGVYLRAGLLVLALLGTRSAASLDDLAETRTWRLLRLLIEPPPPAEEEDDG